MAYETALPNGYMVSDDKTRLDIDLIHRFIAEQSYWGRGRPRAVVERGIAHAICLGAYAPDGSQVGFARIVSDRAVIAHMNDVFVLPEYRGLRLGHALVAAALAHPELATVGRWSLNTDDAHGLYARFGFTVVRSGNAMSLSRPAPG